MGMQMNLGEKIKAYFQEAEIYQTQGLLVESLEKFRVIEGLIKASHNIRNRDGLLKKISARIEYLKKTIQRLDGSNKPPEASPDAQSLMKEMYSFDDPAAKGSASLGGAIALAKFGQYDKAIEEFNRLLDQDALRLDAAKNILWCWLEQNYADYAVSLYQKWRKSNIFPPSEISVIQNYFKDLIKLKGLNLELEIDGLESEQTVEPDSELDEDELLDINSVRFALSRGSREGEKIEMEVSFQSGQYIRTIIPRKEKELIESIKPGDLFKDMVFYSSMAIFSGEGYVSSRSEISAGPKKGDTSLEIKIIKVVS
jgi:tetratricopeptide (TPR) repeat protein